MPSMGEIRSGGFVSQPTSTSPLQTPPELPLDIFKKIFSLLSAQDLISASSVCREWRFIVQETLLLQFQKFQALIQECKGLTPEQQEQLKIVLGKEAALLKPMNMTSINVGKRVVTGVMLLDLKRLLISALKLLDERGFQALFQMVETQFYDCNHIRHIIRLAMLSQQLNMPTYRQKYQDAVSNEVFDNYMRRDFPAFYDLVQSDPGGLLEIIKQERDHRKSLENQLKNKLHNQSLDQELSISRNIEVGMFKKIFFNILAKGDINKALRLIKPRLPQDFPLLDDVIYSCAEKGDGEGVVTTIQLSFKVNPYYSINSVHSDTNSTVWKTHNDKYNQMLMKLAASFAKRGKLKEFLRVMDLFNDEEFKQKQMPISAFCSSSLASGHIEVAFEAAQLITERNKYLKDGRLEDVSRAFLAKGDVEKALEVAKQSATFRKKSWLEEEVSGRFKKTESQLNLEIQMNSLLEDIVNVFLEKGETKKALEAAKLFTDVKRKNRVLGTISKAFFAKGDRKSGWEAAELIIGKR